MAHIFDDPPAVEIGAKQPSKVVEKLGIIARRIRARSKQEASQPPVWTHRGFDPSASAMTLADIERAKPGYSPEETDLFYYPSDPEYYGGPFLT